MKASKGKANPAEVNAARAPQSCVTRLAPSPAATGEPGYRVIAAVAIAVAIVAGCAATGGRAGSRARTTGRTGSGAVHRRLRPRPRPQNQAG
jgi:hypothetical protein